MTTLGIIVLASVQIVLALGFSEIAGGQEATSVVTRAQAMTSIPVSSLRGWHETISDEGRFRVLLPCHAQIGVDDVVTLKGLKCVDSKTKWVVYYSDLDHPVPNDEAYLRNAYHGSAKEIAKKGKRLLKQRDVSVNGRLGTEFAIKGPSGISYMRAFISGGRIYTLSVSGRKMSSVNAAIPKDIQKFFDSFTYWD